MKENELAMAAANNKGKHRELGLRYRQLKGMFAFGDEVGVHMRFHVVHRNERFTLLNREGTSGQGAR